MRIISEFMLKKYPIRVNNFARNISFFSPFFFYKNKKVEILQKRKILHRNKIGIL